MRDLLLCLAATALLVLAYTFASIPLYFAPLAILTIRLFPIAGMDAGLSPKPAHLAPVFLTLLACLALPPDLSDDYHRYLWEGYAQNQGFSPYLNSPDSLYPLLDHPSEGKINNDTMTAIYPPLAQYIFRAGAALDPGVYAWKLVILLWSLAGILLLGWDVRYWYLFSPLILFEGIWNAHLDILGLLPAFWFLRSLHRGKALAAGLALAVMVALKIMPILFLPIGFFYLKRESRAGFLAVFGLALLAFYLPYLDQWQALFQSFIAFSKGWYFNNPIFQLLRAIAGNGTARVLLGLCLLGALAFITRWDAGLERRCAAVWIAVILLSPTFFPWYMIWLLPFIQPARQAYLHGAYAASFVSYLVLIELRTTGVWRESMIWMIPEWILLLFCFWMILRPETTAPEQGTESASAVLA